MSDRQDVSVKTAGLRQFFVVSVVVSVGKDNDGKYVQLDEPAKAGAVKATHAATMMREVFILHSLFGFHF